jgi:hypothetical protein
VSCPLFASVRFGFSLIVRLQRLPAEVFQPVLGAIAGPYIIFSIAGSVLMAVALAARIASGPYRKKK